MSQFTQLAARFDVHANVGNLTSREFTVTDGTDPLDISTWVFDTTNVTVLKLDANSFRLTWPTDKVQSSKWSLRRSVPGPRILIAGDLDISTKPGVSNDDDMTLEVIESDTVIVLEVTGGGTAVGGAGVLVQQDGTTLGTAEALNLVGATVALNGSVATIEITGTGGVTDHGQLDGLTDPDGHPIGAITGLQGALDSEASARAAADSALAVDIEAEASAREAADALLIPLAQKGAASGVASLDSGGVLLDGQIPDAIARDSEVAVLIDTAINELLDGAPGALDTLNELAAAIGDDPDFASSVTSALAGKQPLDIGLTEISALTTTSFGRGLLELASSAAGRTALGLVIGTDVQAWSTVLDQTTAAFTTALATQLSQAAADATEALTAIRKDVWNGSSETITAGMLVSITGSAGAISTVAAADKDDPPDGGSVDGIALEDISPSTVGQIQIGGVATGLNTSGLTAGGQLWLGNDGGFVDARPSSGTIVRIGSVGVVAPSGGSVVLDLPAFEVRGDDVTYDGTLDATRVGDALDELAALSGTIEGNTQTASYTLALDDAGKAVEMNVGTANNVTVPPNSSVAFPVGTVVEVCQIGAGQTTIVAGSGVTIQTPQTLVLTGQWSTVSLRKRATDTWVLAGDVEAA